MEKVMIAILVICDEKHLDFTIKKLISEGWIKDSNMNEVTMMGKVKFQMWKYVDAK